MDNDLYVVLGKEIILALAVCLLIAVADAQLSCKLNNHSYVISSKDVTTLYEYRVIKLIEFFFSCCWIIYYEWI